MIGDGGGAVGRGKCGAGKAGEGGREEREEGDSGRRQSTASRKTRAGVIAPSVVAVRFPLVLSPKAVPVGRGQGEKKVVRKTNSESAAPEPRGRATN
jgi:hypothetical protein